jgi:hypothetical protein
MTKNGKHHMHTHRTREIERHRSAGKISNTMGNYFVTTGLPILRNNWIANGYFTWLQKKKNKKRMTLSLKTNNIDKTKTPWSVLSVQVTVWPQQ